MSVQGRIKISWCPKHLTVYRWPPSGVGSGEGRRSPFPEWGSGAIGASLLKFVLFEMYDYLINFRPVLLGVPLKLGALSGRLVRLWVNPALCMCQIVKGQKLKFKAEVAVLNILQSS